jgi:hypothetical protein
MFECERTKPYVIRYALYLYFLGLSLRGTSKAIEPFVDRSYISIWYWIQQFNAKHIYPSRKKTRVTAFIIYHRIMIYQQSRGRRIICER